LSVLVFIGASMAFLNGVPQFFDETLPWLGERIHLGQVDFTVWDTTSVLAAAFALIAGLRTVLRLVLLREESIRQQTLGSAGKR